MLNCVTPLPHTHTHTHPRWTQAPLFQQHFSPKSDINQQAWFPETENPLSKEKASNTCTSEDWARTRVKHQATRLRHHPITHWGWSFSISTSGIISSDGQTRARLIHIKLRGALGSRGSCTDTKTMWALLFYNLSPVFLHCRHTGPHFAVRRNPHLPL